MESKYAEIFIHSWHTVIESFSPKRITSANVQFPINGPKNCDICILIGIVGDVKGQIFMCMDAQIGKSLTSDMLGGMEITEADELVHSAMSELCNMIMGNACSDISAFDLGVDITPPTIITTGEASVIPIEPLYNISLSFENSETIDFQVALMSAS